MSEPDFCAVLARDHREALAGTAPEARGWLLIEQPGAWGHDALLESDLDHRVARELADRVADLDVRIQIIRRPGARRGVRRAVFLVHSGPGRAWARRLALTDPDELLDLDLEALATGDEPDLGEPETDPILLVCTHAKRDQCCALYGRPLLTAADEARPRQVWESSHVGGHRFAANLVVLPEGLAYGFVDATETTRLLDEHDAGRVVPELLRGRSCDERPGQAADVHLRTRDDVLGIDDVRIDEVVEHAPDRWTVRATVQDRAVEVDVEKQPTGEPRLTGCDKDAPADPGRYVVTATRDAVTR